MGDATADEGREASGGRERALKSMFRVGCMVKRELEDQGRAGDRVWAGRLIRARDSRAY